MSALDFHAVAQLVAERLLNTVVAGVILAGLVGSMLRLIRGQNAGVRFGILSFALLGIAAFPIISGFILGRPGVSKVSAGGAHGEIILPASWACFLFAAWVIGAVLLLFRLAVGVWRVSEVRRNSIEVDLAQLDPMVARSLRMFSPHRPVSICTSGELSVPAVLGLCKPAVVFPAGLLPRLSADEIVMVLQHELAHLCRWDDWTNLAQKVVKALFFFHPAVWWIDSRLALEREMACDDFVLRSRTPGAYAACLVSVAEKLESSRRFAFAQALVSRVHQLSVRVARILDRKRPTRPGLGKSVLGLSAGLFAFVFCAASYMPQLVGFQAQPSNTNARTPGANVAMNHALVHESVVPAVAGTAATKELAGLSPRVIPAAFHPYKAVAKRQSRANPPHAPHDLRVVAAWQPYPSIQRAVIILRAPVDGVYRAPAPVWTLCIWTIGAGDSADKALQSAIVVGWI